MIEIILRKDIQEYEAKPLFGFTYRQVATAALIVASASILGIGLARIGVTGTPMLLAVTCVGGAIGFVGVGRVRGLKFEEWYEIWREDRSWPRVATFSSPIIEPASSRMKRRLSRKEKRIARLDAARSARESEILNQKEA